METMETNESTTQGAPRRLVRSRSNRMVAGICGGMAEYFKVDAALIRLAFVVLVICGGAGIPVYLIAWLIIPLEGEPVSAGDRMVARLRNGNPPAAES